MDWHRQVSCSPLPPCGIGIGRGGIGIGDLSSPADMRMNTQMRSAHVRLPVKVPGEQGVGFMEEERGQ